MKNVIYCISATGNSLTTARLLARELGDYSIVPIPALKDEAEIVVDAENVGFVFPIYYSDMPHLMRRCIGRMRFTGTPYIFSVCTCRGHYGDIAQRLDALLRERGQKLACSLHIPMPGNSRLSTPEENEAAVAAQPGLVARAAKTLRERPVTDYAGEKVPEPSPVHDPSNMRGMAVEDHCVGCGVCRKVCPMGNIQITEGKAVIGEECISCLACFHWCPKEAIWMSKAPEDMMRRFKYHHPEVTLADIAGMKTDEARIHQNS